MYKIIFTILTLNFLYPCNSSNWFDYFPDNMQGCNLNEANLAGVDLSGVDLENSQFENANLTGANLSNANLAYTNFEGANLESATLSNAICWNANFTDANLSLMNSGNADFLNAVFTGSNMYGSFWGGVSYNGNPWADNSTGNLNMSNLCNISISPSGDICASPLIDNNQDGFDDSSFNEGAMTGDVNLDNTLDVLDIVISVNMIINN